jgi:hypothetical protein
MGTLVHKYEDEMFRAANFCASQLPQLGQQLQIDIAGCSPNDLGELSTGGAPFRMNETWPVGAFLDVQPYLRVANSERRRFDCSIRVGVAFEAFRRDVSPQGSPL